jgi:hypothetical protein
MQNVSSDLYHLGIVKVMGVYKYRDLETDRRALDLKRNTYFFILRVSRVPLDACNRDFIFSHRGINYAVANCNEKPQPESGGTGAGAFHLSGRRRDKAVTLRAIPTTVCFRCYLGSEADVG